MSFLQLPTFYLRRALNVLGYTNRRCWSRRFNQVALTPSVSPRPAWSRSVDDWVDKPQTELPITSGKGTPTQKLQTEKLTLSVASEPTSTHRTQPAPTLPKAETKSSLQEQSPPTKPGPPPLLILDLNGCLLYREYQPGRPKIIHPRPHIDQLFQYALSPPTTDQAKHVQGNPNQNWELLIWSSAQPKNVQLMCQQIQVQKRIKPLTTHRARQTNQLDDISNRLGALNFHQTNQDHATKKDQPILRHVLDIWDRSRLDLSSTDFSRKVSTTKDLRKVWNQFSWIDPQTGQEFKWGPHNTVIVDDSPDKLSLQPDNLCMINEFTGDSSDRSLVELVEKLKLLRNAADIPEAIKKINQKSATI